MTARRRLYLVLGVLVLVAVGLVAWVLLHRKPAAVAPHAIPVTVATAVAQDVPLTQTELGSALAWTSVTILSQASGKLIRVNFVEGSYVKAGQLLAQIDPAPYRAALAQAEGALRRDRAALAGARRDLARFQRLLAQNAIAAQTVDDQAALVAQNEGAVQLDEGLVAAARVNLAYCWITSPISGACGRAAGGPGEPGQRERIPGQHAEHVGDPPATRPRRDRWSARPQTLRAAAASAAGAGNASAGSSGSGIVVINQIGIVVINQMQPWR